jgi:elongation factor Ts
MVTTSSMEDIKRLREETGAGIMDAKKALQESNGDFEKAKKWLEQKGMASAAKRAGRATVNGVVEPYIHAGGQIGVLLELDCETDFVARTPEFRELAHELAMQVAATDPRYVSMDEFPAAEADELKEQFRQEAIAAGKPENMAGTIAEGRFKKFAQPLVLLEQSYIRDDSKTVSQLVADVARRTGENVVVRRFSRFQVGA